jgi:hypothetical protein
MNHRWKQLVLLIALLPTAFAVAWGPHWHITRAGIDALGTNHVLASQLGSDLLPLTNYCWIPDYRRIPFRVPEQDFYADDYLLLPGVAKHFDHICPEVEQTYEPYFRRALQALRMESPANAARWIGSILHFVQDTGSPPHAARIRGDTHTKMENWIDASKISISGYQPRLLGTNDDDAVRGLKKRMNELIEFSKVRAKKMQMPVLLANRRAVEPLALESALECARVTADLLHTVATLAQESPAIGFEVSGLVRSQPALSPGRFPARILFHGTNIATLADSSGRFVLRGLKPGSHRIAVLQPGSVMLQTSLVVNATMTNVIFPLTSSGNLVRNGNFFLGWVQANAPDCWTKMNASWEGEILALQRGQRYRVQADFVPGSEAELLVRWSSEQPFVLPKPARPPPFRTTTLNAKSPPFVFTADAEIGLMQVIVRSAAYPTNVIRNVSVVPIVE